MMQARLEAAAETSYYVLPRAADIAPVGAIGIAVSTGLADLPVARVPVAAVAAVARIPVADTGAEMGLDVDTAAAAVEGST